jgi:4-alpha-glucanotransferase
MNVPGTPESNWRWRVLTEQLTAESADRLGALTEETERA